MITPASAIGNTSCIPSTAVIERYENGWFYYEETNTSRISMQLANSGILDYAYRLFSTDVIVHNTDTVDAPSGDIPEELAAEFFLAKRAELLNNSDSSTALAEMFAVQEAEVSTYSYKPIPSEHADMILDKLISKGYSDEHSNRLLAIVGTGGYTVEIREQLLHQCTEKTVFYWK